MEYWEIWNEPDLDPDDSPNKRTRGGTKTQFFDLYEITAKHLKQRFPKIKIGGPALAGDENWAADFLAEMRKRNVKIDFFSWHIYCTEPHTMMEKADRIEELLIKNGYGDVETILNEWNYIKGWEEDFKYSIQTIHGIKGAAFTMACITESQKSNAIDMLMYYDTRPSIFCGAFDLYSYEPLKGYYPLKWYGMFYDMVGEIRCENEPENIYTLCGIDKNGKTLTAVTYYTDNDDSADKDIKIDFNRNGSYEIYQLDSENDGCFKQVTSDLTFVMKANTCILLKEI